MWEKPRNNVNKQKIDFQLTRGSKISIFKKAEESSIHLSYKTTRLRNWQVTKVNIIAHEQNITVTVFFVSERFNVYICEQL